MNPLCCTSWMCTLPYVQARYGPFKQYMARKRTNRSQLPLSRALHIFLATSPLQYMGQTRTFLPEAPVTDALVTGEGFAGEPRAEVREPPGSRVRKRPGADLLCPYVQCSQSRMIENYMALDYMMPGRILDSVSRSPPRAMKTTFPLPTAVGHEI